jgi:hypothetical protein
VNTARLNRAVEQIFEERLPSNPKGRRVKVFYATQIDIAPPTIALIVNDPALVDEGYQRFMINRFRELLPYDEVPIKLLVRARGPGATEAPLEIGRGHEAAKTRRQPRRQPARRGTKPASRQKQRRPAPRRGK